ncbi:hypothetical protein [Asticcacaulis solisilvae]|uniref:hypothetical protein n=1 Tax=Asticcacaulis solisilvae TaxID=1217274 RepID=UPI003FD8073E
MTGDIGNVFRTDATNVGDWFCAPQRYFDFPNKALADILDFDADALAPHVVLGGGGLIAKTFHDHMRRLAELRPRVTSLVAWGIGESEHVDRKGGFVLPYDGLLPDYLKAFDLVGVRDFGAEYPWVPCASCMLEQFDRDYPVTHDVVVYQHKRIPIPIDGFPARTNAGEDIDSVLEFLASGDLVITNSYHGAYWATLLGRRVLAVPNMSKMYRLKHAPVICRAEEWQRFAPLAPRYPEALTECRAANVAFFESVKALWATS